MTQPQREWLDVDYYRTLGVPNTATEKEITKAYRKLAKENHPDSHPGREERFKEISTAYTVLSDAEKRKSYDEVRRLGPGAFGGFTGGGFGGPGAGGSGGDLGDLLGGLRFAVSRMQERRIHFFRVGSAEAGEFPAGLLPSCGLARAVKARSAAVSGIRFTWCLLCQAS